VKIVRRAGAIILMAFGALGALASLSDVVRGKEPAWHLAGIVAGVGFVLGGWSLWRGDAPRRTGAILLLSVAAFSGLMGLEDLLSGREAALALLAVELRLGIPALVCGWLIWRGRAARQVGAALVVAWAASFTLQALAYADEPITAVVLVARAGVPGFVCGWLMAHGCKLRQIASVLLVTWPMSYLIYALRGADSGTALGELAIGLPTILVGWLLWRGHEPRWLQPAPSPTTSTIEDAPCPGCPDCQ